MDRAGLAAALISLMSVAACGETMKQYTKAEVEILAVSRTAPTSTEIVYQPILDTLYYCPGAKIRADTGRQKISFVRCKIGEACPVDVKAEKLPEGQWKIIVDAPPDRIDFVFRDGEMISR